MSANNENKPSMGVLVQSDDDFINNTPVTQVPTDDNDNIPSTEDHDLSIQDSTVNENTISLDAIAHSADNLSTIATATQTNEDDNATIATIEEPALELQESIFTLNLDDMIRVIGGEFDRDFYLNSYEDVRSSGIEPIVHYLTQGWREGRRPMPTFDPFAYRYIYFDVSKNNIEPFYHYITVGRAQGRSAQFNLDINKLAQIEPHVDVEWYHETYPDILSAGINPVFHYYYQGWKEGRNPSLNFSTNDYLAAHPDLLLKQRNPLYDYVLSSTSVSKEEIIKAKSIRDVDFEGNPQELIRRLFDAEHYLRRYPDIRAANVDPLQHFLQHGWHEGRSPNSWFNCQFYLEAYEDVRKAGINPFMHFITAGHKEGRLPTYPFDRHGVYLAFDYWYPSHYFSLPVMASRYDYDTAKAPEALQNRPRILVHFHVFYESAIEQVLRALRNISEPFDMVFTSPRAELAAAVEAAQTRVGLPFLREHAFILCENRGRDIGPWIVEVLKKAADYEIGLHVHTKMSKEKGDLGGRWRDDLLAKLLFDPTYVEALIGLFDDPRVGLVYPTPFHEIEPQLQWGHNRSLAQSLVIKMLGPQVLLPNSPPDFPAGMMFWYRPVAMAPILQLGLGYNDFPSEPIRDDGTIAHALERTLGTVTRKAGFDLLKTRPTRVGSKRMLMGAPEISVVIPAHNAEPWIGDCLESIRDQVAETPNYEIIVVENGSTDGTAHVLKRYEKFANLRVLSGSALGAGGARNVGLDAARGRYVTFVDADDLLVRDALDTLYAEAEAHKATLTCTQLRMFFADSFMERAMPAAREPFQRTIQNTELFAQGANYFVDPEVVNSLTMLLNDFGPCCKLYLRKFLNERGIRFDEGVNYEDNLFVYRVYASAEIIRIVPKVTYLYRRPQPQSAKFTQSTQKKKSAFLDQIRALHDITTQVIAPMTNETWRRVALKAIDDKLTSTVEQYPDWSSSESMRTATVALVDLTHEMRAH